LGEKYSAELLLNYCVRFYDRQFITRDHARGGIAGKFDDLLNDHLQAGMPLSAGIPSVALFAQKLHLSASYFSDIIKKETGKTARELIQLRLLDFSKQKPVNSGQAISEIVYELGFKYPQHFIRFFKKNVRYTPHEYTVVNKDLS
jgi:AraC family transcriptional activator of pobA